MSVHFHQVELDQPFRVDPQGRIAFTSDPKRVLMNRVRTIIGTEVGERVMRPDYGVPLQVLLFEGDDDMLGTILAGDIERALQEYEPGVIVQSVTTDSSDQLDGVINLNVIYSAVNSPLETLTIPVNTAVLYRGGAIDEERSG